jgi:hypothetical protein
LYWFILTKWIFCAGIPPTDWMFCIEKSLLSECFVLKNPYWLNILYWKIPTGWIFGTGKSLLIEYFVLENPDRLNILYWKIPTDWIFCTGKSRPTA